MRSRDTLDKPADDDLIIDQHNREIRENQS